ncbi:hypothetical protein AArcSl_1606 [Halalkaliarchaeum desulfuricum]|uniref:Uncharacterized protein n=1 Tax=Halalkaliarchaeum desulfuricum TaxID=2055893 RepID=A0A343TJG3_9EURY|nr:hypothetical protein [Halalkaliarchaeum desulfuricum]AUX09235.1 hypothetical protein AArcSl_1606 [Halalkaliarchaeum desulfuricum]
MTREFPGEVREAVELLVAEEGREAAERRLQDRFRTTSGRERDRALAGLAILRREDT